MLAAALASALPQLPAWAQAAQTTPGGSAIRLPALGDAAGEDFTVGTERRLGEQIMSELRRDPDYLDDPLLIDYVQSLWQPLLATARLRGDITAETDSALDGKPSWCATVRSTPLPCPAAMWACTSG